MATPVAADNPSWVILGAAGHATSLEDVLRSSGHRVIAVSGHPPSSSTWSVPVLTSDAEAVRHAAGSGASVALGIGDNHIRLDVAHSVTERSRLAPIVSHTATCSDRAELGVGAAVFHHAHVGPGARIGSAVIVNTGAIVEHDSVVGDGAHIAPGACLLGGCSVGQRTLVGSGARILPGVSVGDNVVVGAGAVVIHDVPSGTTVAGVPARPVM